MPASLLFRVTQAGYSLALGVWVGALVMLGLTAVTAFGVIPDYEPVLAAPPFDEPAFDGRAATVLAGAVVNASLMKLATSGSPRWRWRCCAWRRRRCCCGIGWSSGGDRRATRSACCCWRFSPRWCCTSASASGPRCGKSWRRCTTQTPVQVARASARVVFDMLHARSEVLHQGLLLLAAAALVISPFTAPPSPSGKHTEAIPASCTARATQAARPRVTLFDGASLHHPKTSGTAKRPRRPGRQTHPPDRRMSRRWTRMNANTDQASIPRVGWSRSARRVTNLVSSIRAVHLRFIPPVDRSV